MDDSTGPCGSIVDIKLLCEWMFGFFVVNDGRSLLSAGSVNGSTENGLLVVCDGLTEFDDFVVENDVLNGLNGLIVVDSLNVSGRSKITFSSISCTSFTK